MMTYDAYLELFPDGTVLAQVLELPGCLARGADEVTALNNMRVAVPDYFRWLSMQDADTPTVSGEVELTVHERVEVTMQGLHEVRAFFGPDAEPLGDEDLGWLLALMSYAHIDLMRFVGNLAPDVLAWQPNPETWSIAQTVDHLAQIEIWLATRLDDRPQVPVVTELPGASVPRYDKIHEQAMVRYSGTTPEQRALIRDHTGERWSLRKQMRRSIEHERTRTEGIAVALANYQTR
jgi:hypothetical protein